MAPRLEFRATSTPGATVGRTVVAAGVGVAGDGVAAGVAVAGGGDVYLAMLNGAVQKFVKQ